MNKIKINKFKNTIMLLMPLILLSACSKQLPVTVSTLTDTKSIPNGFSTASSFHILPPQGNNQLLSKEISYKIMEKLEQLNYKFTNAESADYYIKLSYNITSATKTVSVSKYIPEQTIIKKSKTHANGKPTKNYEEEIVKPADFIIVPETHTFFNKEINIIVFDAAEYRRNNIEDHLWEGSAASCEKNNDPRENLDYLLDSALNRFGKNTGKNIKDVHTIADNRPYWKQLLS